VNIGQFVDAEQVRAFSESLPNVLVARTFTFFCSDPGQQIIKRDIQELGVNRVVVAACTPKIHEPTYRELLVDAGLSPYFFEMVNLREHCSFVHSKDKARATEKAKALVAGGVYRAMALEDVPRKEVPVTRSVLVVGAGIAGMNAAINLANQGIKVYLVEKEPTIGGRMAQLDRVFPTDDCAI
jgi:heterodisulfide reductase subunit A